MTAEVTRIRASSSPHRMHAFLDAAAADPADAFSTRGDTAPRMGLREVRCRLGHLLAAGFRPELLELAPQRLVERFRRRHESNPVCASLTYAHFAAPLVCAPTTGGPLRKVLGFALIGLAIAGAAYGDTRRAAADPALMHFVSRPDLTPPVIAIDAKGKAIAP